MSTTVEENTGDASAFQVGNVPANNRSHCSEASIRSCEELDRSHLHPAPTAAREGWSWALGRGHTVTVCRPSVVRSATRRVGFRALKKTLEALYTTKVSNRDRTSR